jgi:hypothetical protein
MSSRVTGVLKLLHVLSWIVFLGLCIEAGGFIFNAFFVLFINPVGAEKFWTGIDLSAILAHDQNQFLLIVTIMIMVSVLKAFLFFLIVKIFHDKHLDLAHPFNKTLGRYLFNLAYVSLGIGTLSYLGSKVISEVLSRNVSVPSMEQLHIGGTEVWFIMGITLYVFAQIFKKGVELQAENDLTV